LHGKIDRGERPGPPARLEERSAAAVDDEDRPGRYSAAFDWNRVVASDDTSPCARTA
jgi:hypothetical protein